MTINIDDLTLGQAKELVQQLLPLLGQSAPASSQANADQPERAVLVTTAYRGVFFGYAKDVSGTTIKLRAARNCVFWPDANKGFLGLASIGPQEGARVGPATDIELRDITCIATCTPEAVKLWESAPWK